MRARIVVLLSALFFGACAGKDPVSSGSGGDASGTQPAGKMATSNRVAATCEKCRSTQPGSLIVEPVVASSRPPERIVAAGMDMVTLVFKASAFAEQMNVTRYIVTHSIFGVGNDKVKARSTFSNHKLWCEDDELTTVVAGVALQFARPVLEEYLDFNLGTAGAYQIPDREERICAVRSRVNKWSGVASGSVHGFSLRPDPLGDGTHAVTARGEDSGALLGGPDQEVYSEAVVVRHSYPIVRFRQLPSSALSGGATSQATIASWSMEAVGGQTRHKKVSFQVTLDDATRIPGNPSTELALNNFKLYRNNGLMSPFEYVIFKDGGTSQEYQLSEFGTAVLSDPGGTVISAVFRNRDGWYFGGEEVIDGGTTNTYALKADIANAHVGSSAGKDFIAVTMLGDDGISVVTSPLVDHPAGAVTVGTAGANYHFIWSDYSAEIGLHDSSVPSSVSWDWTNGFLVPTSADQRNHLPLDPWVLSK